MFVAVPALQRNQRNSARRNDIAYIKAQTDTMIANNGGKLPTNPQASLAKILKPTELNYIGLADSASLTLVSVSGSSEITDANLLTGGTVPARNTIYIGENNTTTTTGGNWSARTDNTLVGFTGKKCATTINPAALNASVQDAQRNTVAWFYYLEGDDNLYCDSDEN